MQHTLILQLYPSQAQYQALLETMRAFNAAADYVAAVAFNKETGSRVALQRFVYEDIRARFGLPAQLAVGAIGKASVAYYRFRGTNRKPVFAGEGAVLYDRRIMSVKGLAQVSLTTCEGRILVDFLVRAYQPATLHANQGQAYLRLHGEIFYLTVTEELPASTSAVGTDPTWGPFISIDDDLGITGLVPPQEVVGATQSAHPQTAPDE